MSAVLSAMFSGSILSNLVRRNWSKDTYEQSIAGVPFLGGPLWILQVDIGLGPWVVQGSRFPPESAAWPWPDWPAARTVRHGSRIGMAAGVGCRRYGKLEGAASDEGSGTDASFSCLRVAQNGSKPALGRVV